MTAKRKSNLLSDYHRRQLRRAEKLIRRIGTVADFGLKLAVILGAIFLFYRIVPAFLPGGAIEQLMGGAR